MSSAQRRRLFDPWLFLVSIIWGSNFVAYKLVLRAVSPLVIVGFRFALVTPILLAAAALLSRRDERRPVNLPMLIWAGLFVMGSQQIIFVLAVNMTTAYVAALLTSTAPIWTAVIAALGGQERLSRLNWLGVILGFGGAATVILAGAHTTGIPASTPILGDFLLMVSAILYGYFMVIARPLVLDHGGVRTTAWCYLLSCILILPVSWHDLAAAPWRSLDANTWLLMAGYISLLGGAFGFIVWYTMVGRVGSSATAVYQYLVPVVAMATAALFLGERPEALQLAGALVTFAGLALARRSRERLRTGAGGE
jgi:drug/metabolite transporter (DMT)-like permease